MSEKPLRFRMGSCHIIDDLNPVPEWAPEHLPKVERLIQFLENRADLLVTKLDWLVGLIVATKK